MKVYKVKVNGKTYKVELESMEEVKSTIATKEVAKEEVKAAPVTTGAGKEVVSPIQGTVVKINVAPGKIVKKGDVLVIVEAMKLENEVVSPYDGEVSQVLVSKGQSVTAKQAMFIIK